MFFFFTSKDSKRANILFFISHRKHGKHGKSLSDRFHGLHGFPFFSHRKSRKERIFINVNYRELVVNVRELFGAGAFLLFLLVLRDSFANTDFLFSPAEKAERAEIFVRGSLSVFSVISV